MLEYSRGLGVSVATLLYNCAAVCRFTSIKTRVIMITGCTAVIRRAQIMRGKGHFPVRTILTGCKAMDRKVLRVQRCMNCGHEQEWYVRSENVSPELTDRDIYGILSGPHPDTLSHCEECKLFSCQSVIGFKGVVPDE